MSRDSKKAGVADGKDLRREELRPVDLPERYSIRSKNNGRELICSESPSLSVHIERGMSIPSTAFRKSPAGSIYLDGAAQGGPFVDSERGLFNLDHHEGCVRSFTLSTCEQAMVLTRKGLDLKGREWTIYANDPDLDTVLAIWVLLNHLRLNDGNPEIRARVMPLVRLEGTIDAHGLEMVELCALTPEVQEKLLGDLERLRSREIFFKRERKWGEIDFLQYTIDVLRAIDAMVYSSRDFEGVVEIEELARADIGDNRIALICRSEKGIYEIEPELRRLYGNNLGVVVLQKDPGTYTLRQVNMFLPAALERVYEQLNLIDPAAGNRRSGNRWGGSGEIGGSPRATGTALTPQQISSALAQSYRKPTMAKRMGAFSLTALEAAALMAVPLVAIYLLAWSHDPAGSLESYLQNYTGVYAGALCALSGALVAAAVRMRRKLLGLCMPTGSDWLVLLPGALLGALIGGAWILPAALTSFRSILDLQLAYIASALGFPIGAEVVFRGLVHGRLARYFSTMRSEGRWFVSWPVFISSTLYAAFSALPFLPFFDRGLALTFVGALLFGLSSGMARERSESLLPCLILHWSCLFMLVLGSPLLWNRIGLGL
jgi:membrane protease YdiL (CAAX protease family)